MSSNNNFELRNPDSGLTTSLPVRSGTIGPNVLDISNLNRDHGVFTYDPAFAATAAQSLPLKEGSLGSRLRGLFLIASSRECARE